MESVDSLIEAIEVFHGAVVIATHSEMVLHATARRLVVFDAGAPWFFQGTYQDFLDRVGWKDEEMLPKIEPQETDGERRKAERKELRRARADLITSRSKALSPLQKRIEAVEEQIMHLEERIKEDNVSLVRASQYGDGKSITALSIAVHEARKSIETLFEELESLSVELHQKSAEFEVLFSKLEE
jgi:ATP-binding cassette subfamily F protein 3